MGECGCVGNDERYWFPAPNNGIYLLTISGGCTDCCAPPGVTVELVERGKKSREWKEREWYIDGELQFQDWGNGNKGAAVVTGFEKHEFIKALLPHLVGVDSKKMGENGAIDESGADVILDEMYEDAMFRPRIISQVTENEVEDA